MTSILLKLLDLFRPIFEWQKIDFVQLRAIVGVKLMMDNRRAPSFQTQQQKEASSSFVWVIIAYLVFGGFFSFLIAYVPSIIFPYSIYHSFLIVMVTLTLVSDFSAVLLDTSDNTIILPKPVSAATFYAARTTHILLYIGQISFSLALAPIIVTFFVHGSVAGIVTLATSILSVIFSVSLTHGLYLVIMRFFSEEKLKNIVNYFQIFMTMLMMGAYQILPRMLGIQSLEKVTSDLSWWFIFIPPMWMAGTIDFFVHFNINWMFLTAVGLTILVPFASWKYVNEYLAPFFTTKLADIGTRSPSSSAQKEKSSKGISSWLTNLFTKPGLERGSFEFVSMGFGRDRKLKLRIYPAIGSFAIILLAIFLNELKEQSFGEILQSLPNTKAHLVVIYACILVLLTVAAEIHYTDDYKASWIFQSAPIAKPGKILSGAFKAIMVKFFLPIYIFASIVILMIWREKAVGDLLLGAAGCWLLMLTLSVVTDKRLPLSLPVTARNQTESFLRVIVSMILIGLVAGGHYVISKFSWAVYAAAILAALGCFFLQKIYENATWDDIK